MRRAIFLWTGGLATVAVVAVVGARHVVESNRKLHVKEQRELESEFKQLKTAVDEQSGLLQLLLRRANAPAAPVPVNQIVERCSHDEAVGTKRGGEPLRATKAPTQDQLEAKARGGEIVEAAISQGVWTDQDAQNLRELLPRLGLEEAQELRRQLIVEANAQRLKVAARFAPF